MRKTTVVTMLTLALLLSSLPLFKAEAQITNFVPNCAGTDDTTAFSGLITAIGSNVGTITLPYKATSAMCAVNNLTIPANVTLNGNYGAIKVNTGQTLTVLGPVAAPASKSLFYNALAGQGTVTFAGNTVVSTLSASWWSGGDFGQKVTAAKTALPSEGGVVDAKNLTGAQSLSGTLTLDKAFTAYIFGNVHLTQGTNQVVIPAGTDGVSLDGTFVSFLQSATTGTKFDYSGTGIGVLIGDTGSQTREVSVRNIYIYNSNSAGSGLKAVNTINGLYSVRAASPSGVSGTGTGIEIAGGSGSGTTYAAYNTVIPRINGYQYGVKFSGSGSFASNNNHIRGGYISAHGATSTYCIRVDDGDSNTAETDCETYGTGVYTAAGTKNFYGVVRMENIGAFGADTRGDGGWLTVLAPAELLTFVNSGTNNTVIDPYHPTNTTIYGQDFRNAIGLTAINLFDANRAVQLNAYDDLPQTGAIKVNLCAGCGTGGLLIGHNGTIDFRMRPDGYYPERDNEQPLGLLAQRWSEGNFVIGRFATATIGGGTTFTYAAHGTSVLVAGTVTVSNANVTANSRIFVNRFTDGGTVGSSYSVTRSAGVGFTVTSKDGAGATQTLDTSTVAYEIIN